MEFKAHTPLILGTFFLLILSACGMGVETMLCGDSCPNLPAIQTQDPIALTFSPVSGPIGTLVTISGADFTTATSASIAGKNAVIVSQSTTSLIGFVMPGALSGLISVSIASGSFFSSSQFVVTPTGLPINQQGLKVLGSGEVGNGYLGHSVAISADGNTAIAGGNTDNTNIGAAWIFTRNGGTWSQQGSKLVASDSVGVSYQGWSSALSADGNTAIVGGIWDNATKGAAWVYVRSAGTWTQQGLKLPAAALTANANLGRSVALSADGNTALVGGDNDSVGVGATWAFTRSSGVWSQQGAKFVGSGAVGNASQGDGVALSADGNTAVVGGKSDNAGAGAAWIFARNGGTWSQQGLKLVGSGAVGNANQGIAVAMNADGTTVAIGGNADNGNVGAVWIFTLSAGTWSQQGLKLVGSGATGSSNQGNAVSLSADGNTLIVGGYGDNANAGGFWEFTRTGGAWTQQGAKLIGSGNTGSAYQGYSVGLSADGFTAIIGGNGDNATKGAAWIFIP